jgi:uncharacterized membrane protein YgaE (UPF0421/DUF939 family)
VAARRKLSELIGRRILKTALSVFLVGTISRLLGLPLFFPIVAAVVTIEPTLSESLSKAKVRFPAVAIAAAAALGFHYAFGPQPIAYAVSLLTAIFILNLLRWHDGLVIATLTAVAMIPEAGEVDHVTSFLLRLVGTMLGMVVSAFINLFFLPPNYFPLIRQNIDKLHADLSDLLVEIGTLIAGGHPPSWTDLEDAMERIIEEYRLVGHYLNLQKKVHRLRNRNRALTRLLALYRKRAALHEPVFLHLGNIISERTYQATLDAEQRRIVVDFIRVIRQVFLDNGNLDHLHAMRSSLNSILMRHYDGSAVLPDEGELSSPGGINPALSLIYDLLGLNAAIFRLGHFERQHGECKVAPDKLHYMTFRLRRRLPDRY